jgi:hypothetical protein
MLFKTPLEPRRAFFISYPPKEKITREVKNVL